MILTEPGLFGDALEMQVEGDDGDDEVALIQKIKKMWCI